ncbi:MAG TPA: ATP-dependent zinc metalloprotease FtsH [Polyangiaceae bacterium]|nr:ATP-dependent zinc metalloprotease FtsH [Polyangiaceae bacterium]
MAVDPSAAQPPRSSSTPPEPERSRASWLTWVVPFLLLGMLTWGQYFSPGEGKHTSISYTDFYHLVSEGKVASAAIKGQNVIGALKGPETVAGKSVTSFTSMLPPQEDRDLLPLLREKAVNVTVKSEEQPLVVQILLTILPWVLILGAWAWISRRAQGMLSKNPLARMVRGPTRRYVHESQVPVKFDDVAGLKAAKQDLREIVDFLKEPARFQRLGGKVPRGVLLVGPPGTGKTLLARAVAGEAGVPFFSISGSEFIELFVGVGASRVRALFEEAKKEAPSIVFIDEIDAVGRSRGTGLGGGNDEREQTLNQLLSEMDGFTRNDLTVVMAATNRPDVLDAALLRPGRFDRRIVVDRPERAARRAILAVHCRNKPLGSDVDLGAIADNTPGFSGADLANLVNEAALSATRRHAETIDARDFTQAYDKIVLGDVRETLLDAEEKKRVAVHEAGHAVVAHFTPETEPLERVSILPRGMALGATHQTPSADKHIMTQPEIDARLRVLMAGYAAERIVYGNPSSGAENDLRRATELAIKMVAHFGMSENVGPVFYEHRNEHPFLGQMLATEGATSDATIHLIEQEARRVLLRASEDAKKTIMQHRDPLDRLVAALLATETVDRTELQTLLGPPASQVTKPRTAGLSALPEA